MKNNQKYQAACSRRIQSANAQFGKTHFFDTLYNLPQEQTMRNVYNTNQPFLTSVVALDAGEARRTLSPDWEINASSALERLRDRCHDTLRVRLDPFTDLPLFENQNSPFPYFLCPFFLLLPLLKQKSLLCKISFQFQDTSANH